MHILCSQSYTYYVYSHAHTMFIVIIIFVCYLLLLFVVRCMFPCTCVSVYDFDERRGGTWCVVCDVWHGESSQIQTSGWNERQILPLSSLFRCVGVLFVLFRCLVFIFSFLLLGTRYDPISQLLQYSMDIH